MSGLIKTYIVLHLISVVFSQITICSLKNGSVGTCLSVSKCPSAQEDLRKKIKPTLCKFEGATPIVCCDVDPILASLDLVPERISEEKCLEYFKLDVQTTITTTTTSNPLTTTPRYIIGGVNANFDEFPHMALLGYGKKANFEFKCCGSLISEQFVLTAAHCLESRDHGKISLVRLGDLDTTTDKEPAEPQDFTVAETYTPPEYDFESVYHDIALIKLDRPVIFTRYVKPACLQTKFKIKGNYPLVLTGWGSLEYGGKFHTYLQKAYLQNLPKENCMKSYRVEPRLPNGFDHQLQICGGDLKSNVDACHGDSGGPIQFKMQEYKNVHQIVGVTSFGNNCGLVAGVYTRVSRYISWIESIVWPK